MTVPPIERPSLTQSRMNVLVWGDSGCGKTTLASTAPGHKLWVQFDPQGVTSIANRDDFVAIDLSGSSATQTMMEFNRPDPYGLGRYMIDHPQIGTVVFDSVTALAQLALVYAVSRAGGNSNIDVPGMNGYGVRNNVMRRVVVSILQLCAQHEKHLILITHEGAPDKDKDGNTIATTMSLSNNLANDVSLRFNEVWWMKDTGLTRTIYVRPWGVYKPMKTRMFAPGNLTHFVWNYDADTQTGDGINEWWNAWMANGGVKIPLPRLAKK